jgi:hypothetical protein
MAGLQHSASLLFLSVKEQYWVSVGGAKEFSCNSESHQILTATARNTGALKRIVFKLCCSMWATPVQQSVFAKHGLGGNGKGWQQAGSVSLTSLAKLDLQEDPITLFLHFVMGQFHGIGFRDVTNK